MQVRGCYGKGRRYAGLVLLGGALLAGAIGCHRSPAADVVATVNGKDILSSELDRQYQIWKMGQGETPQDTSPEQAGIARLTVLRQMIDEEILQQRAAKLNVAASDEDVNAALTERKLPYTQEEFDKQLKQHNETLDDFKRYLRRGLTENKLLNKEIDSKINITDGEISGYYAAHKAEFNLIEPQYHLAQIVVLAGPSPQGGNLQNNKASGDADAKKKIQTLLQRLNGGEDFGSVAMNFSEDPNTASNGGDRGFVSETALHSEPDAYNAIAKLKPGQFTDSLAVYDGAGAAHKTIGYAIYKLISRDAPGQRTLNDVRVQASIRQRLREDHAQLLKTAYYEKMRDEATVHNYLADQILRDGAK